MTIGSRWASMLRARYRAWLSTPSSGALPTSAGALALRVLLASCAALVLCAPAPVHAVYAIAQYGEPKYPPDFKHFDYVNPDAPKGGTLVLANPNRLTSFDKFNPF